jgi:hypothetical protein
MHFSITRFIKLLSALGLTPENDDVECASLGVKAHPRLSVFIDIENVRNDFCNSLCI